MYDLTTIIQTVSAYERNNLVYPTTNVSLILFNTTAVARINENLVV